MKLQFGLNSVSGSRRSRQDNQVNSKSDPEDRETGTVIFCQVFVPFLVAGFANVASGIILDHAQRWSSFQAVTELFILVTALLGFKGKRNFVLNNTHSQRTVHFKEIWRCACQRAWQHKRTLENLTIVRHNVK